MAHNNTARKFSTKYKIHKTMWCKLGSISHMLHHHKAKVKYNVAIQNTDNMIWNTREESKNTSSVWSQFHSAHAHGLPLSLICILLFIVALLYFALDLFSIVLRYITLLYSALGLFSIVHRCITLLYSGFWFVVYCSSMHCSAVFCFGSVFYCLSLHYSSVF